MKRKSHELKCWPRYYQHVRAGTKTFERRVNDRDFCFGDLVLLREWDPDKTYCEEKRAFVGPAKGYTGAERVFKIGYILPLGIYEGDHEVVVFSILRLEER